jgi:lipoyl synthase
MIRCSLGTAKVLGLKKVKVDVLPTTAYLMVGERCRFNCAFCAQARESGARADLLSRVSWPTFAKDVFLQRLEASKAHKGLQRICFQVVQDKAALEAAKDWVKTVQAETKLPICVSAGPRTVAEVEELIKLGVDHVSIALDAATPEIYARSKDGSWEGRMALLCKCAEMFPGRMATHLIVGLGESEEEMIRCLQILYDRRVTVALFAFTPVKGTRMEEVAQPEMTHYRRVQVAHDLIKNKLACIANFKFKEGQLISYGISATDLEQSRGGIPFQTSGCSGCNRPYYNETPGEDLYNYPSSLTQEEVKRAWSQVLEKLESAKH